MRFAKLVIATKNKGKYTEFKEIITNTAGRNFADEIIFAPDVAELVVEETGKTYAENAMLKARAWAEETRLPCLADDSGLEVMALGGAPGVYSSRVVRGRDVDRAAWLLSKLSKETYRRARFAAALSLCVPGEYTIITEGYCKGSIAEHPSGENGFGYDPVFIPDGYDHTFAELSSGVKNEISHRAEAFRKLSEILSPQTMGD